MHQNYTQDNQNSEFDSIQDNTLIEGAERRKYQTTADEDFKEVVLKVDTLVNTECEDKSQRVIPSRCNSDRANTSNLCNITNGKMIQSTTRAQNMYTSCNNNNFSHKISFNETSHASHFKQTLSKSNIHLNQSQKFGKYTEKSQLRSDTKIKHEVSFDIPVAKQPTFSKATTNRSVFKKCKTTRVGKIQQIMFLKNMVQKMMRYVPSAMLKKLTQFHLDIIGDHSLARNERRTASYILENIPILKPNNYIYDIWKISQIFIVGYQLFRCLLLIGFENDFAIDPIRVVSIVFFIFDFIFNINAGYYEGLDVVTERRKIIKHNMVEIIASLISIIAQIYNENEILNLIFVVRLRTLFQNISIVEQNFSLNQKYPIVVTISKLLMLIILIAHTFACGFVLITKFEKDYKINWIIKQNLINEPWQKVYLNALYFSFITMITVGYGDITPITDIEKMYVIFFTLITCIVYAYVVNTIGLLFQEFSQKSAEFKKQRYQVLSYMNDRRISKPVQISVIKYLEYTQQQEKVLKYSKVGEQFLQTIPISLRQEVYEDFYGRIINDVSLFKKNLSKKCLSALSQIMKEQTYGPDEKVFTQGDQDYKFFFVMSGKIEIEVTLNSTFNQSRTLGHLKRGQQYGIHSLFSSEERRVTAKCTENTSILIIHKEDFLAVLREFREDYEIYCMLKDSIQASYENCGVSCTSCLYKDHEIVQCELLQYKPRHSPIINKHIFYRDQELRDTSFVRKGLRSSFTLKLNYYIRQQLKSLRVNILNKEFNNIVTKLSRRHEDLQEAIRDTGHEHDEIFLTLIPEFCYYKSEIVMALDEDDLNKSSLYGSLQNHSDYNNSYFENNQKLTQDFDKILEDNSRDLVYQQKQANKHQNELYKLLSKQKSVQFTGINEETSSEVQHTKHQQSVVESACSIVPVSGIALVGQMNINSNLNTQSMTPLLKTVNQINPNVNQGQFSLSGQNIPLNNQKQQGQQSHLTLSNTYQIPSSVNITDTPNIPMNIIHSHTANVYYQQQSSHTPSNIQNGMPSSENKIVLSQISGNGKQHPLHAFQRENSLSKQLPYSPNNFGQSNRTIQIPSTLGGDVTPQNIKHLNSNTNSMDSFQKYQQYQQQLQVENNTIENSISLNLSPPKFKPIQSFDLLPNANEINFPSSQNIQNQQQQQQFLEEQNKSNNAHKFPRDKEKKQTQKGKRFNKKETTKVDKSMQLFNNSVNKQNGDCLTDQQETTQRQQSYDDEPVRKSRRKITVFKDNLRLSIKDKRSEYHKEQTIGQQLAFSTTTGENNNIIEDEFMRKDIYVIMEFDMIHEFRHYFPDFNYSQIKFRNKCDNLPDQIQSILQHTTNIVLKKNLKQI